MAYASRSMAETEIRYAQIKKECLGLTYVLLLCIWTYTAEADRCPLVSIIKKNLNEMLLRIPRLDIKIQRYDFELQTSSVSQYTFNSSTDESNEQY